MSMYVCRETLGEKGTVTCFAMAAQSSRHSGPSGTVASAYSREGCGCLGARHYRRAASCQRNDLGGGRHAAGKTSRHSDRGGNALGRPCHGFPRATVGTCGRDCHRHGVWRVLATWMAPVIHQGATARCDWARPLTLRPAANDAHSRSRWSKVVARPLTNRGPRAKSYGVGRQESIQFKPLSRRHGGAHPEPVGQRSDRGWGRSSEPARPTASAAWSPPSSTTRTTSWRTRRAAIVWPVHAARL